MNVTTIGVASAARVGACQTLESNNMNLNLSPRHYARTINAPRTHEQHHSQAYHLTRFEVLRCTTIEMLSEFVRIVVCSALVRRDSDYETDMGTIEIWPIGFPGEIMAQYM
jgi:hypothetical protein